MRNNWIRSIKKVNKPENREIINLILENEDVEKDEYTGSVNRKMEDAAAAYSG